MAEITIFCPHCNQELALEEEYLGLEVQCPTCNKDFVAQCEEENAAAEPEEPAAEPEEPAAEPGEVAEVGDKKGVFGKFKNAASGIKGAVAAVGNIDVKKAASDIKGAVNSAVGNINSRLNEMQSEEEDLEFLEIEQKIDRIKKGVPVRKLYFCTLAVSAVLFLIAGAILAAINGIYGHAQAVFGCFIIVVVCLVISVISSIILARNRRIIDKKTSVEKAATLLERKRKMLATFFSNIAAANSLAKSVESIADSVDGDAGVAAKGFAAFFSFAIRKNAANKVVIDNIYNIFNQVREHDLGYLETLDVLPRFGKKSSQLVAESHTLYSPLISEDAKYEFDERGEFIYSKEEVTKVYTFEDQLLVFTALWDYTTGELYNEQTEAFFFKDITDISTENSYDKVKTVDWVTPPPPEIKPFPVKIFCCITGALIVLWVILSLIFGFVERHLAVAAELFGGLILLILFLWAFIYDLKCQKKIFPRKVETIKRVRASETFTITSTSGRSIGMTILCDGWFEAKNGKYEKRSDGEKIIHAIRKMIEEKKVAVNE